MKNLLVLAAILLLTTTMHAQITCNYEASTSPPPFNPNALLKAGNCVSNNGYCHTPKGDLKMMLVYVTFIEDDTIPGTDNLSSVWPNN